MTVAALEAGVAAALATLAARDLAAPLARLRRPRVAGRAFTRFGGRLGSLTIVRRLSPPRDLGGRLLAAGRPGGLRPREWMALKAAVDAWMKQGLDGGGWKKHLDAAMR